MYYPTRRAVLPAERPDVSRGMLVVAGDRVTIKLDLQDRAGAPVIALDLPAESITRCPDGTVEIGASFRCDPRLLADRLAACDQGDAHTHEG